MFIAEILHRNTQVSKGFLIEEEYRGKFGFGLTPFRHEAYRFNDESEALAAAQDMVGDNQALSIVIHYHEVM